jgi:hypothetical protein
LEEIDDGKKEKHGSEASTRPSIVYSFISTDRRPAGGCADLPVLVFSASRKHKASMAGFTDMKISWVAGLGPGCKMFKFTSPIPQALS